MRSAVQATRTLVHIRIFFFSPPLSPSTCFAISRHLLPCSSRFDHGAQVGFLHHTHPSPTGNEEEESPELISTALPFHFLHFSESMFLYFKNNECLGGRHLELHSDNFELELYVLLTSSCSEAELGTVQAGRRDDLGRDENGAEDRPARPSPVR